MENWINNLDKASFSNLNQITTKHIDIDLQIDLEQRIIKGEVNLVLQSLIFLNISKVLESTQFIYLDTKFLNITRVQINNQDAPFEILKFTEHQNNLGDQLKIHLKEIFEKDSQIDLLISYQTYQGNQDSATGVSWLDPSQTFGGKYPFLLTQCEPIYCRTLFPCQDSPSVKSTYHITATISKPFSVFVSGILYKMDYFEEEMKFSFKQVIPIPSYLFSIVAGNLEQREVSQRCFVISEPEIVEKCTKEFSEMEKYLSTIEKIIFEYKWKTYTAVVLPKSFPFGGMENPNLTFVSPSIVVGDKSGTDVLIHEMVHSWSGNLMSCANWESFWLNEGFTVFFERETIREIYGEEIYQLECVNGNRSLQKAVEAYGNDHSFTTLTPNLQHENPDDAFSAVPYEKGFQYMRFLQEKIGRENFKGFMSSTIEYFANKSVKADEFKEHLIQYLNKQNLNLDIEWQLWVLTPGLPKYQLPFEQEVIAKYQKYIDLLISDSDKFFAPENFDTIKNFTTKQKIFFLDQLQIAHEQNQITLDMVIRLNKSFDIFGSWLNPELLTRYLVLALNLNYEEAFGQPLLQMLQSTGRMKFIKPLFNALINMNKELALQYFQQCNHCYHSIATEQVKKMIQKKQ